MKHNHRITPGHMGGKYVEGNVISVEVTNCNKQTANHVMWHYANWRLWGREEDLLAWKGLSGYLSREDLIQERLVLGGKISGGKLKESGFIQSLGKEHGAKAMVPGGWLYENRTEYAKLGYEAGIGKPENRLSREERIALAKKIYSEGKGLAAISPERRKEIGKVAGAISGQLHKERGTGVCGISPEEHSNRMSETNKQKWKCPECEYTGNARSVNTHMNEAHNLPRSAKVKMVG